MQVSQRRADMLKKHDCLSDRQREFLDGLFGILLLEVESLVR